jgi:hypothetical protein
MEGKHPMVACLKVWSAHPICLTAVSKKRMIEPDRSEIAAPATVFSVKSLQYPRSARLAIRVCSEGRQTRMKRTEQVMGPHVGIFL